MLESWKLGLIKVVEGVGVDLIISFTSPRRPRDSSCSDSNAWHFLKFNFPANIAPHALLHFSEPTDPSLYNDQISADRVSYFMRARRKR